MVHWKQSAGSLDIEPPQKMQGDIAAVFKIALKK
jgi:hypothetical protein